MIADGGLKQNEIAPELSNIICVECLGIVGGDLLQHRRGHLSSEAPREHRDAISLDERCRVNDRLQQRLARRCVDRLLAVREEQHDLSRTHAGIAVVDSVEEVPHGFEAVGDRGLAVRGHIVNSVVDLGLVIRPSNARRRVFRERYHREARRIYAEGAEHAHQLVREGL